MPNWCYNSVRLSHTSSKKITSLIKVLKKKNCELFMHFRPRPFEEEENWYVWNIENWGVKWDISSICSWEKLDNNTVNVCFPWAPPIEMFQYLTSNGWKVNAMWHETGMCILGRFDQGVIEHYNNYDFTSQEGIDAVPKDLAEFANLQGMLENYLWEQAHPNSEFGVSETVTELETNTDTSFTNEDIRSIYNCVTIVIGNREQDNEISAMFDDHFKDPIIDNLKLLKNKVAKMLDNIQ